MYEALVAYKNEYGDCAVPKAWPKNQKLGVWVGTRRKNRSKLPEDQIKMLDDIGFDWAPHTTYWEQMYTQLVAYKEEHGDCLVSQRGPEKQLANWVANRRHNKIALSEDQIRRLDEIGFDWDPNTTRFEQRYGELVAYKKEYGDCVVPVKWPENPKLGTWSKDLRERRPNLSEDQIRRLDEIGFVWDVLAFRFEQMSAELVAYKEEHGHCVVPRRWPENQQMANWVSTLRAKRSKLPKDQIKRLDEIGFVWDVAAYKKAQKKGQ
jgi:hypothetical protein